MRIELHINKKIHFGGFFCLEVSNKDAELYLFGRRAIIQKICREEYDLCIERLMLIG